MSRLAAAFLLLVVVACFAEGAGGYVGGFAYELDKLDVPASGAVSGALTAGWCGALGSTGLARL